MSKRIGSIKTSEGDGDAITVWASMAGVEIEAYSTGGGVLTLSTMEALVLRELALRAVEEVVRMQNREPDEPEPGVGG